MTTQPEHRIEAGQEYEKRDPADNSTVCIRVKGGVGLGTSTVRVVTVTADGRELRPRHIAVSRLHTDGKPRKNGYRLVRNADGTPAAGGAA